MKLLDKVVDVYYDVVFRVEDLVDSVKYKVLDLVDAVKGHKSELDNLVGQEIDLVQDDVKPKTRKKKKKTSKKKK